MIFSLFFWFLVLIIFALILLFSVIYDAYGGNVFYKFLVIVIPIGAMVLYGNDVINASFTIIFIISDFFSLCFLVSLAQKKDEADYMRTMRAFDDMMKNR